MAEHNDQEWVQQETTELSQRIRSTCFWEDYEDLLDDAIAIQLAQALYRHQNERAHTSMQRSIRKDEALRGIQRHSAELAARMHHVLCSEEVAPKLGQGYKAALDELPPGTAFIHGRADAGPVLDILEFEAHSAEDPILELWMTVHRLHALTVAAGRMRDQDFRNPKGAPSKGQKDLIKTLKHTLATCMKTVADKQLAEGIQELLGLIDIRIAVHTIENILST